MVKKTPRRLYPEKIRVKNMQDFESFAAMNQKTALIMDDAVVFLDVMPKDFVDCVITSPPYWNQRIYDVDKKLNEVVIGNEEAPEDYVEKLVNLFSKVKRVLKPSGSLWLNLGDKYCNKNLMGMPWRVALALQNDGWILRNDVIWHQMKGTQSAKDRLRMNYEHFFHFVKRKDYYYDANSIKIKPEKIPTSLNGKLVSATGVSGIKYKKQIIESKELSPQEKQNALRALEQTLNEMHEGKVVDFRMTIRGQQRTLHSNNGGVSGRAKELHNKGFFIMKSRSEGYMPNDIWNIVPEDELRNDEHYAVFPVELLRIPILATSPKGGIILDPFLGTGSTLIAALQFNRRGIGIEISEKYMKTAKDRINKTQTRLI